MFFWVRVEMLNVKSAVSLPTSSGHPAVPALQLIGGVGGCVCGENVDGTQPSDVNGLGLLTREAREWLEEGGGVKQLQQPLN